MRSKIYGFFSIDINGSTEFARRLWPRSVAFAMVASSSRYEDRETHISSGD